MKIISILALYVCDGYCLGDGLTNASRRIVESGIPGDSKLRGKKEFGFGEHAAFCS